MAGLKIKIGADASQFERTMRGVRRDVSGVKKGILAFGGAVGAIWAVNKAFDALRASTQKIGGFLREASQEASGMESLAVQFEVLLKSADAAEDRLAELVDFAATTPFEIKELANTSKLLQTLGGNILATGDGLRLVGNLAAAAGQPIQEIGLHVGRLFNAISNGTSAGESVARLQELGLLADGAKRRFEELAKAQKKGEAPAMKSAEIMALLGKELVNVDGMMARLAETTEGKLSNMQDNIDQLQAAFGEGFNDGLKVAIDAANDFLPSLKEKMGDAGEIIGSTIREAVEGNMTMLLEIGRTIGEVILDGIKLGLDQAASRVVGGAVGAVGQIGESMEENGKFGVSKLGSAIRFIANPTARRINRGADMGLQEGLLNMRLDALQRLNGLNQMNVQSQANAASMSLGLQGYNPFVGADHTGSIEDIKQMKVLLHKIVNQMSGFAN